MAFWAQQNSLQVLSLSTQRFIYPLWCLKSFKSRHMLRKEDKSNTPLVIFVLQKCIQLQFYSGLLPGWVKPPHITHPQSDWSLSGASCGNEPFEIQIYNKPFCSGKVSSFPWILSSLCSLQLIWLPTLLKITSHTYFKDLFQMSKTGPHMWFIIGFKQNCLSIAEDQNAFYWLLHNWFLHKNLIFWTIKILLRGIIVSITLKNILTETW